MGLLDSGAIGRYHADMGGSTGESAAREAARKQIAGINEAMGELGTGYDTAGKFYDPYAQAGLTAWDRMQQGSTAEGLGTSLEALQRSPAIMALINARAKRVGNQLGATGLSRSGYGMRELGRVDEESLLGLENLLMGRTGNIAGIGYGAGQAQSGLGLDKAKSLADLMQLRGQVRATGVLGAAQAQVQGSQNRYTAMHNAGSAVMGMFGGMGGGGGGSAPSGGTQSGISTQQAQYYNPNAASNYQTGYNQMQA